VTSEPVKVAAKPVKVSAKAVEVLAKAVEPLAEGVLTVLGWLGAAPGRAGWLVAKIIAETSRLRG